MAVLPRARLFFACAEVAVDEHNSSITIRDPLHAVYLNEPVAEAIVRMRRTLFLCASHRRSGQVSLPGGSLRR
jgi:hypothetical protein